MKHWIAHFFRLNRGKAIFTLDDYGNTWVAFQCATCKRISGSYLRTKKDQNKQE